MSAAFQIVHQHTPNPDYTLTEHDRRIQIVKTHDWLNGFYLHVSGPRAEELLPQLYENTYTVNNLQPTPITIRVGERFAAGYHTSRNAKPQFPSMQQEDIFLFEPHDVDYTGVTCIPLVLNAYGSDLGPGFPVVAVMFMTLTLTFYWSEDIAAALREHELTLKIVVEECGYLESIQRSEHACREHRKQVPVLDDDGEMTRTLRLIEGVMVLE